MAEINQALWRFALGSAKTTSSARCRMWRAAATTRRKKPIKLLWRSWLSTCQIWQFVLKSKVVHPKMMQMIKKMQSIRPEWDTEKCPTLRSVEHDIKCWCQSILSFSSKYIFHPAKWWGKCEREQSRRRCLAATVTSSSPLAKHSWSVLWWLHCQ